VCVSNNARPSHGKREKKTPWVDLGGGKMETYALYSFVGEERWLHAENDMLEERWKRRDLGREDKVSEWKYTTINRST